MPQTTASATSVTTVDYESTLILAVEVSDRSWVVAAQVPGLARTKARQTIKPAAAALLAAIEGYKQRAGALGKAVSRIVLVCEAAHSGFWLARWLAIRGIEAHLIHPTSVPVDRHGRRAKSDTIDVELLLRTLLAWLRGDPRVCTMVPIPDAVVEDARRLGREREQLVRERIILTNRIGSILATLGVTGYNPLRRDRHTPLDALRTPLEAALPAGARAQIGRILERLELVLAQIAEVERQRDAVLETETPGQSEQLIRDLVRLSGIGVQSATLLVREAFVRSFRNAKALGAYAGLTGTPIAAAACTANKGSARPATAACASPWWSWLGCGCAISPGVRWRAGSANAWRTAKAA
jgi:transposase